MKNVSRETVEKLEAFEKLVVKWTQKINLIAPSTISDIRNRHTLDSLQLFAVRDDLGSWLDLGSGGGFPGIVIAIALQEHSSSAAVTLVESDNRKCVFLRQAARQLDLSINVLNTRTEQLEKHNSKTVTARALAPLPKLIGYAQPHLDPDGVLLTPKGQNWKKEVEAAQVRWSFDYDVVKSESDENAVVLKLSNIEQIL